MDFLANVRASTSHNPIGLHGLLQGWLYHYLLLPTKIIFVFHGTEENSRDMTYPALDDRQPTNHLTNLRTAASPIVLSEPTHSFTTNDTHNQKHLLNLSPLPLAV
jgi:hypothetical protein